MKLIHKKKLNKGNYDFDRYVNSIRFSLFIFSLALVSIENKHQTLQTFLDNISKHL